MSRSLINPIFQANLSKIDSRNTIATNQGIWLAIDGQYLCKIRVRKSVELLESNAHCFNRIEARIDSSVCFRMRLSRCPTLYTNTWFRTTDTEQHANCEFHHNFPRLSYQL